MKSYIFKVELTQGEDGRWNAAIPALRACHTWGNTKEEALAHVQAALRGCVRDMMAQGDLLPVDVEIIDAPVAAVTL